MVFHKRGIFTGLKHKSLGWTRTILRRSPEWFIENQHAASGLGLAAAKNSAGETVLCQVCSYAIMSGKLPNGWVYESCSAFMPVKFIGTDPIYSEWISRLPQSDASVGTARVSSDTSVAPSMDAAMDAAMDTHK